MQEPAEPVNWHTGHIHEDIVTAYVFSGLRYVPEACDRFLDELVQINRNVLGGKDPFRPRGPVAFEAWPSWKVRDSKLITDLNSLGSKERRESPHELAPSEEQRLKGTVIPDVVLHGEGWTLVVESEWSMDCNVPQLIEQVLLSKSDSPENPDRTFVLLINRRVSPPGALRARVDSIVSRFPDAGLDSSDIVGRILWFNWQRFASIFATIPGNEVLQDRGAFLAKAGIQASTPFPVPLLEEAALLSVGIETRLRRRDSQSLQEAAELAGTFMARNLIKEAPNVQRRRAGPRPSDAQGS